MRAQQGPVWLPEVNRLFFVSNRLGDQATPDQHVQLWTLDPTSLVTKQVTPSIPLLMGNGATNWSPSEVLVLSQVCALSQPHASCVNFVPFMRCNEVAGDCLLK